MASRLRSVYLANGKTSGIITSAAICEVMLPGNAAITGENGIGKTTALQIIPLFFGCLPSRIVNTASTVQAMMKFMLPHPTSVIIFEYQRGDSEDDVRMVTIRKQQNNNSDAPEYRFFRCGYREELFVRNREDGSQIFLDDEGTVRTAREMGIVVEAKINTSEYRNIILRTRSHSKDAEMIQKMARQYSFANRPLPHLDRLIGAVVKEAIEFKDFIAVAVAMVQETVGGSGAQGNGKVAIKTMRDQMQLWLSNRDACENAVKLGPKIESLQKNIDGHRKHKSVLRSLRADVQALSKIVSESKAKTTKALELLQGLRKTEVDAEQIHVQRANDLLRRLQDESSDLNVRVDALRKKSEYFKNQEAEFWSEKTKELPQLHEQLGQLGRAIALTKSKAEGITREIEEEISDLERQTAVRLEKLESEKVLPNEVMISGLRNLKNEENSNRQLIIRKHQDVIEGLNDVVGVLIRDEAIAKERINNPVVDQDFIDAQNKSEVLLELVQEELDKTSKALVQAKYTHHENEKANERAKSLHQQASNNVKRVKVELEAIKLSQQPKPGTMMAALQGSDDQSWRSNLARVLNPGLLNRSDLNLQQPNDTDSQDSIFGWKISVESIETPEWADAAQLSRAITEKSNDYEQAEQMELRAKEVFDETLKSIQKSNKSISEASAAFSIAESNYKRQKSVVADCKQSLNGAKAIATEDAKRKHASIFEQKIAKNSEIKRVKLEQQTELNNVFAFFEGEHKRIVRVCEEAIENINQKKVEFSNSQALAKRKLSNERERRLKESGVDFDMLSHQERDNTILKNKIQEQEQNLALVGDWLSWIKDEGPLKLRDLSRSFEGGKKDIQLAQDSISEINEAKKESASSFIRQESKFKRTISENETEEVQLDGLNIQLADFEPATTSVVNENTLGSALKGQVANALTVHETQKNDISADSRHLENKLVSGQNAVSQLVGGYIDSNLTSQDYGPIDRASLLCEAYAKIETQVITPLNTELGTMLEVLQSFRLRISRYEDEVKTFNKNLQNGIKGIVGEFDRLKDFNISVVTTFETIGFLKQLDDLAVIIRDQRNMAYMASIRTIPDASTAMKLRAVMQSIGESSMEIDLNNYITLSGSANDSGIIKPFHNEDDLKHLSSTGITAIAMVTLLAGMLNVVRGMDDIYIPWATDEVGRFDSHNFSAMMTMLGENKIDVVTASPHLTAAAYGYFQHRYLFQPQSRWAIYAGSEDYLEKINLQALAEKSEHEIKEFA